MRSPVAGLQAGIAVAAGLALSFCGHAGSRGTAAKSAAGPHPGQAPATVHFHLGQEPTQAQIQAADIAVAPDGTGLPPGQGTAAAGRSVYMTQCAFCHGEVGQGGASAPALAGGRGTLTSSRPELTVGSFWPYATTLWDYIDRAMPYPQPGSLNPSQAYAVTAYVLYINQIVGLQQVLDRKTLPMVRMPNRCGFLPAPQTGVPKPR